MSSKNRARDDQSSHANKFAAVYAAAQEIEQNWRQLSSGIRHAPGGHYSQHFKTLDASFKQALDRLHDELQNPTLILATTGTTSSGKSTIVNLLCGADIMPRMSQEMSAGIVTITHAQNGKTVLKISKTAGAKWECGEWRNLSDVQIQERLTATMSLFNESRGTNKPESPRIELAYPIACFQQDSPLQLTGLPQSTRFQILDLPGIKNLMDESNSQIIRTYCREALCLVAYNSEEVDKDKQRLLVEQVIEQVKEMGGSPARMLFIVNRIDAFNRDSNTSENVKNHIEEIRRQIVEALNSHLPEYRDATDHLTFSCLSSLPALYALQLTKSENRVDAAEELDKHFNYLIPRAILAELPRNTDRWEEHEFIQVSDAVWKSSHASDFYISLRQHIEQHFATLIIPPSVQRFTNAVEAAIGESSRTCYSELNSSNENYQAAVNQLYEKNTNLKQFLAQSSAALIGPFEEFTKNLSKKNAEITQNSGDKKQKTADSYLSHYMELAIEELAENYQNRISSEKLGRLYLWHEELSFWARSTLDGVWQSIKSKKKNFSNTQAEHLPEGLQNRLEQVCSTLWKSEFLTVHGKDMRTLDQSEKQKAEKMKTVLNDFSREIATILAEILQKRSQRELHRIQEALERLLHVYLDEIRVGVKDIAPEWGLSIGRNLLDDIPPPELKPPLLTVGVQTRTENERNPWRLWITRREVNYDEIPNIDTIRDDWEASLKDQFDLLVVPFITSLLTSLTALNKKVEQTQEEVLQDAQDKLDEANRRHRDKRDSDEAYWQPLAIQSEQLTQALNDFIENGKNI